MHTCWLLLTLWAFCILMLNVEAEFVSFSSVSFPSLNANIFKPTLVKNYVFIPPFDPPMVDFCGNFATDATLNTTVKYLVSKTSRPSFPTANILNIDCMKYFCTNSNETGYLHYNASSRFVKDEKYRAELSFIANHCFLCNSATGKQFRDAISSETRPTCAEFPSTFGQVVSLMNDHCIINAGMTTATNLSSSSETSTDMKTFHFGIMDARFFDSGTIYASILSKSVAKNSSTDNLAYLLSTIYPLKSGSASIFKSSEIPMYCHCGKTNDYTFSCYDINHMFLTPLRYYAAPIVFLIISIISGTVFFIAVVIPKIKVMWSILTKEPEYKKDENYYFGPESTHVVVSYLRAIYLLTVGDIKIHSIFWNILLICFISLVEITYFARDFTNPILTFTIDDVGGTIRSAAFVCMALCFCSMIVHWSHTLDLVKRGNSKGCLSIFNTSITISFYLFMIAFLVIGLIVALVTNNLVIFFFFFALLYTSLSLIFCVGFTIVGVTILARIRKGKTNVISVKLTKSTMAINIVNFALVIVAGISMPTFFLGWDLYTVELGLLRGPAYDVCILLGLNCVTYILFTPLEGKTVYGETCSEAVHRVLNCEIFCLARKEEETTNTETNPSSRTHSRKTKTFEPVASTTEMNDISESKDQI